MPGTIEILKFMLENHLIIEYDCLDIEIKKVAIDTQAIPGDLSWIPYSPSDKQMREFNGSMLICLKSTRMERTIIRNYKTFVQCENPKLAMAMVIDNFFSQITWSISFVDSTVIHTKCGTNVTIGPNCCIGIAGQGYAKDDDKHIHFPHLGKVIIKDNVSIGANTVICRGTIGNTIIKSGTKIGNLVNIGHNAKIGKNVMIIAGATICGGVQIGDNAWIGPGATIINKVKIGKGSQVGIGSVVTKDVPDNSTVVGNPARKI